MAIFIHILTLLFGYVVFEIIRKKRYKEVPYVSFIMIFSFIGCAFLSLVSFLWPLYVLPLFMLLFGLIILLMVVHDFVSVLKCRTKISGTYCGYRTYYGGNGVSNTVPVFSYNYLGKDYYEQSNQSFAYKKMTEGKVYDLYIDPKHPAIFILKRRVQFKTLLFLIMGVFFFSCGCMLL